MIQEPLEVAAVFLVGLIIGLSAYVIHAFMKKIETMVEEIHNHQTSILSLYSDSIQTSQVTVKLSHISYPLFSIRWEMLGKNRQSIIDYLIECRKEMKRGEFLYAALAQFYERLGYTAFNFFIVTDVSELPNPKIQEDLVFCVDDLEFTDASTLQMAMKLSSYFTALDRFSKVL